MEREAHGGKGARAQWFGLWPRTRPCEAEHLGAFFYYSAHMLAGPCLHTAPAGKQPTRLVVAYPAGTPLCTARVDSDSSPDRSVPAGTLAAANYRPIGSACGGRGRGPGSADHVLTGHGIFRCGFIIHRNEHGASIHACRARCRVPWSH
jgi:hypothetical protein